MLGEYPYNFLFNKVLANSQDSISIILTFALSVTLPVMRWKSC